MPSRWKQLRYRLEWIGLTMAAKVIPRLSRPACFHLANFLGALMAMVDRQGRRVAMANLHVALGETLSAAERRQVMRRSFQNFARTMLDFLWSPRLTAQNFSEYIDFENFEEIARAGGPERSAMIACYHYSNFEWLSLASAYAGLNGTIIAQEFKNPRLDPIFKRIREQSGHDLIPRQRGIVRLYKVLRRKGRTALLVDLTVPPGRDAVVIECFGRKTSVTSAHAWLHKQTGVPIIPAHCEPLDNGRYRLVCHRKIETNPGMSLQEIAQACWNSFEPHVRRHPEPWLWMYKHWRYRPRGEAEEMYPFYAHVSPHFERLLRGEDGRGN
jgi:KDO2-lipid IV(A) lauroyltransferase